MINFSRVIYDVTKAHSLLCNVGFVTVRLELRKSPHLGEVILYYLFVDVVVAAGCYLTIAKQY